MTEMKMELCQVSESTSEASMRDHHVLIDRPQEKGGADRGPMGESFSQPQEAAVS